MKRAVTLCLSIMMCFVLLPIAAETLPAREAFIGDIIAGAKQLYDAAKGRLQSAHYASDVYLCKNFTVDVFKQSAGKYRMAEFPDVSLVIPNNLSKEDSKPYQYGIEWEEITPENGNPFYPAHQFKYDKNLTKKENREKATAFMREVRKGDYLQMSAKYYYGVGAHSLIFIEDYDAALDQVHWADSNMKGEKRNGIRYGLPQFDAVKKTEWFVDAFCQPGRGATLYRLRDDIIVKP